MVDIVAANGPRMEGDRAHLCRPAHNRHLGRTDLIGRPPRGELNPGCLHVLGRAPRDAFLVEGIPAAALAGGEDDAGMHALRPALERGWSLAERTHDPV